jgi:uncharacterized RDD family membrane protein YckC
MPPPSNRPGPNYGYGSEPVDRFGRPLAAWWQRLVAIILDGLILSVPRSIVTRIIVGSGTAGGGLYVASWRAELIVLGIVFAVIDLAYFAFLNGSEHGQTVGQMMLGIAVRDSASGDAIGPQRAGLRILVLYPGLLLSWLPVIGAVLGVYTLVAALSPLWDRRRQGFHDKVAHTDVIKVR